MSERKFILEFNDWDYEDRFYEVPELILKEFKQIALDRDISAAWEWFIEHIDYKNDDQNKSVKTGRIDMGLDKVFLAWDNADDCFHEWEEFGL